MLSKKEFNHLKDKKNLSNDISMIQSENRNNEKKRKRKKRRNRKSKDSIFPNNIGG